MPGQSGTTGMVVCPECHGHGAPQGDGSGWDGTSMHTPACDYCGGRLEVAEPLSTERCPACGWTHHDRIGECGNCGETAASIETAIKDHHRDRWG